MQNMSAKQRDREKHGEVNHRPRPWKLQEITTVYMDYVTGQGVFDTGAPFKASILGRTKNPTLTDKLNSVDHATGNLSRVKIVFTGKVPPNDRNTRHWLLVETKGWVGEHHLGTPPAGRFFNTLTGKRIDIRVAYEWFGDTALKPEQARQAWTLLSKMLTDVWRDIPGSPSGSPLLMSPAATGTNLWAASLPPGLDPAPVPHDVAEEIHATSGQHHQDHFVTGPGMDSHPDVVPMIDTRAVSSLPGFAYVDGRFMYSSVCWKLGTGPGVRLAREQAWNHWDADKFFRGRMRVKFTVPDTWQGPGILGVQHKNPADGWFYPNRPGAKHTTWADGSELYVADQQGWGIEPEEAIIFSKTMPAARKRFEEGQTKATRKNVEAAPLDEWARNLVVLRTAIMKEPGLDAGMKKAIGAALRAILIQGIGSFASRGRSATRTTTDPTQIPSDVHVERKGTIFTYQQPQTLDGRNRQFYHPEYTAQIWGRGRAKVMSSRASGVYTGALHVDPATLIGINGDAIYTTRAPEWAFPTERRGGADDGKVGRLRLQGYLDGPVTPPGSRMERDTLRARAVKNGTQTPDSAIDQAEFRLEFEPTDDRMGSYDSADPETESN